MRLVDVSKSSMFTNQCDLGINSATSWLTLEANMNARNHWLITVNNWVADSRT